MSMFVTTVDLIFAIAFAATAFASPITFPLASTPTYVSPITTTYPSPVFAT